MSQSADDHLNASTSLKKVGSSNVVDTNSTAPIATLIEKFNVPDPNLPSGPSKVRLPAVRAGQRLLGSPSGNSISVVSDGPTSPKTGQLLPRSPSQAEMVKSPSGNQQISTSPRTDLKPLSEIPVQRSASAHPAPTSGPIPPTTPRKDAPVELPKKVDSTSTLAPVAEESPRDPVEAGSPRPSPESPAAVTSPAATPRDDNATPAVDQQQNGEGTKVTSPRPEPAAATEPTPTVEPTKEPEAQKPTKPATVVATTVEIPAESTKAEPTEPAKAAEATSTPEPSPRPDPSPTTADNSSDSEPTIAATTSTPSSDQPNGQEDGSRSGIRRKFQRTRSNESLSRSMSMPTPPSHLRLSSQSSSRGPTSSPTPPLKLPTVPSSAQAGSSSESETDEDKSRSRGRSNTVGSQFVPMIRKSLSTKPSKPRTITPRLSASQPAVPADVLSCSTDSTSVESTVNTAATTSSGEEFAPNSIELCHLFALITNHKRTEKCDKATVYLFPFYYQLLVSHLDLIKRLAHRFKHPKAETGEGLEGKDARNQRLRILKLLFKWLEPRAAELIHDEGWVSQFKKLKEAVVALGDQKLTALATKLNKKLREEHRKHMESLAEAPLASPRPFSAPALPNPDDDPTDTPSEPLTLEQVDAAYLALQITIYDWRMYKCIPTAAFSSAYAHKSNEQAKAFLSHAVLVGKWAVFEATSKKNRRSRVVTLKKLIDVAKELLDLQNFSSAAFIVEALRSPQVAGQTQEWSELSEGSKATWAVLSALFNPADNYQAYRRRLLHLKAPCILYLDLFTSDLALINESIATTQPNGHYSLRKLVPLGRISSLIYRSKTNSGKVSVYDSILDSRILDIIAQANASPARARSKSAAVTPHSVSPSPTRGISPSRKASLSTSSPKEVSPSSRKNRDSDSPSRMSRTDSQGPKEGKDAIPEGTVAAKRSKTSYTMKNRPKPSLTDDEGD